MATPSSAAGPPHRRGLLVAALRLLGAIDMLALVAVVMPRGWIAWTHASAGLGEFPDASVAEYLAIRLGSLYALHGLMVLFVSRDVERYRPLIHFLAVVALGHGGVMLGIDLAVGMPLWWVLLEGPAFSATGVVVWLALRLDRA